jgi:trk system potassium uptake protein TrkH
MNYDIIFYIIGWVIKVEGLFMFLPALVSFIYGEKDEGLVFLACAALCTFAGILMTRQKPENNQFYSREGYVTVALSWIVLSAVGAVPFVVTGCIPNSVDAMFEIISGFTTTGASIVTDVEALPRGILFWRSFSHWIGGMGILVFLLIMLPVMGGQSIYLIKAESTGASVGKLAPKMKSTAFYLYGIYFFMSLVMLVFLLAGRMKLFDALCVVFGTAGTGGFGTYADSIAGFSTYHQYVIGIFMFLFGINFSFYFLLFNRKIKDAFSMEEVRWYAIIFVVVTVAITMNILNFYGGNFAKAFKYGFFQVSSIMTSTGFATDDFNKWPVFSKTLLVMIMFIGACAGSTGGGMKVSRYIIWFKAVVKELSYLVHPRSIKILKMDGKKIEHETIRAVNVYLFAFVLIFAFSLIILSLDASIDMTEAFTAVATTFNNIGPGLGSLGPAGNFAHLSSLSKVVLMFDMLAGRLEIFPLLVIFLPGTWKK